MVRPTNTNINSGELKRGALSTPDMKFIQANVDKLTPEQMGEALNRTAEPIQRYIERERLGAQYKNKREDDKSQNEIMRELKSKPFWRKELPLQLTEIERDLFAESWVSHIAQFGGDILQTEEFELKDLLILDALKTRELKEAKALRGRRDKYEEMVSAEMRLPVSQRDMNRLNELEAKIAALSRNAEEKETNFKNLVNQQDKIRKNLTKIRASRTEDLNKAKIDFTAAIKLLETDYRERQEQARQAEILKAAQEKSYKDLSSYYTYIDNKVDRPILNSETVSQKDEE